MHASALPAAAANTAAALRAHQLTIRDVDPAGMPHIKPYYTGELVPVEDAGGAVQITCTAQPAVCITQHIFQSA
jgi:hypothetical protein